MADHPPTTPFFGLSLPSDLQRRLVTLADEAWGAVMVPETGIARRLADAGGDGDGEAGDSPLSGPGVAWSSGVTPALPPSWPSGDGTVLAYLFGSGFDPAVPHGELTSAPYARVELDREANIKVTPLTDTLQVIGRQGTEPLSAIDLAIYRTIAEVEATVLHHVAAGTVPAEGDPQGEAVRLYYRRWVAHHGTVTSAVRDDHRAFLAWVGR